MEIFFSLLLPAGVQKGLTIKADDKGNEEFVKRGV